jgi:hypothetical protein
MRFVVNNCGSRPILGVTFEGAKYAPQPDAKLDLLSGVEARISVLKPNETHRFQVEAIDQQGYSVFEMTKDPHGNERYEKDRDPADVAASIRFMVADGIWWRRSTSGDVIRLGPKGAES